MAHILVNFAKASAGGGKNILHNFLKNSSKLDEKHKYHILVPNYDDYKKFSNDNIEIIKTHNLWSINILFIFYYYLYIPLICKEKKIDLLLNFGDVVIPTLKIKQIYYFDWAYAVYNEDYIWQNMSFVGKLMRKVKVYLIDKNIKKVSLVILQTKNMKNRIYEKYSLSSVKVYPTPIELLNNNSTELTTINNKKRNLTLFYPASYSPHKNFLLIIKFANEIKRRGGEIKLNLTLTDLEFTDLLSKTNLNSNDQILINLGRLNKEGLQKEYNNCDLVFMPTLLESYGLPYFEAMSFGKPIITSDLDFAKEVCGENAFYFNPFQVNDVFKSIDEYSNDKNLIVKIKPNLNKIKNLPSWKDEMNNFSNEINNILQN